MKTISDLDFRQKNSIEKSGTAILLCCAIHIKQKFREFRAVLCFRENKKGVCSFLQTPFEIEMLSLIEAEVVNQHRVVFRCRSSVC